MGSYRKTLKSATVNGFEISAVESWEKFSCVPRYYISVARVDDFRARDYPTARTTWRRKYNEILKAAARF